MSQYKLLNKEDYITILVNKLSALRTNRVTPSILDNIAVYIPSWGATFKIVELATINIPMPNTLLITPYDSKVSSSAIEKAIRESNLGVNPVNDGIGIKLNFPSLTTEDREKRCKVAKELGEEIKVKLRNNRRDMIQITKSNKDMIKDDVERYEKSLQIEVDNMNKEIDETVKLKQVELMAM
ncbi:MAG: ribosome-recycling factor [Candidatus Parcubacteria bacterium]|nr:ribosome-recycling factor [Candidatus Paceibacterota bacterium]